jgi:hypothetical protein
MAAIVKGRLDRLRAHCSNRQLAKETRIGLECDTLRHSSLSCIANLTDN